MSVSLLFIAAVIGLLAGVLGGLAGVGGSIVILPGLHLALGDDPESIHHLYMASAMLVNIAVAVPAARRHAKAGAIRKDLLKPLLIIASVAILVGVVTSNHVSGDWLKDGLAAFIAFYCLSNIVKVFRGEHPHAPERERTSLPRLIVAGGLTGFAGGLLGLGGGGIMVPILQTLCRVPLRQAIATSSGVMCVTAVIGAALKLGTLGQHDQPIGRAVLLGLAIAPTAVLGATIGATLTHRLPLKAVRVCVAVLLLIAAAKMVGVI